MKRSEDVVRNISRSNRAIINSLNGDGRNFRAARKSITVTKSERDTRVRGTGIDESVCMYGFVFWEGEGNGDEKMIGG